MQQMHFIELDEVNTLKKKQGLSGFIELRPFDVVLASMISSGY